MRRKLLVGVFLFLVVTVVYLLLSRAPFRVHVVTIATGFLIAISAVTAAWVPVTSRGARVLLLFGVAVVGAIVLPIGLHRTVRALDPLPLSIFIGYAVLLSVLLPLFLAAVAMLDRYVGRLMGLSPQSGDSGGE